MNTRIIITPGGERLVLVPEADFEALVAAAEDNADRTAVAEFRRKLAAGEEELIPASVVERLVSGENRVRVWREHRGLTGAALAKQAGLAQAYLSQIETGAREGTIETYGKLAGALRVSLDDLAG